MKLIKGLLLIGLGVLILFGLWRFGTLLGFLLVYPWIVSKVTGIVINPHLVNITALVIASILYFGIYRGLYRKNKNWGYAAVIGLIILQSAFMFIAEKDRFFSVTSGDVLKYYTTNPLNGELQVFDAPIFDAFGQKAEPVDFKTAQEIYQQQNGENYPNQEVAFGDIKNFFDKRTGRALVYYYQDTTGIHLFVHDGYDPISGLQLLPVTPDIAKEVQRNRPTPPQSLNTDTSTLEAKKAGTVTTKTAKSIWIKESFQELVLSAERIWTNESFLEFVFAVIAILVMLFIVLAAMGFSVGSFFGLKRQSGQPYKYRRRSRRATYIPHAGVVQNDPKKVVASIDPMGEYYRYLLALQTIEKGSSIDTSSFQNEYYRFDLEMRLIQKGFKITVSDYSNPYYAYQINSALIARGWRVAI